MKKIVGILLASIFLFSGQVYASQSLDSVWGLQENLNLNWKRLEDRLEKIFPYYKYEYLDETKGNIYFIRKYRDKNYLQNINKKSGNIYGYDLNTHTWRYEGYLERSSVTEDVYSY